MMIYDHVAEKTDLFLHCLLLIFIYDSFHNITMKIIAVAIDFSILEKTEKWSESLLNYLSLRLAWFYVLIKHLGEESNIFFQEEKVSGKNYPIT